MSNFAFLQAVSGRDLYEPARRAEMAVFSDPRAARFYARFALESAVTWLYSYDASLPEPYSKKLDALLHAPAFKALLGSALLAKANVIRRLGNAAVHRDDGREASEQQRDALAAVRELFHVMYWLARTYHQKAAPPAGVQFDTAAVPVIKYVVAEKLDALQAQAAGLVGGARGSGCRRAGACGGRG